MDYFIMCQHFIYYMILSKLRNEGITVLICNCQQMWKFKRRSAVTGTSWSSRNQHKCIFICKINLTTTYPQRKRRLCSPVTIKLDTVYTNVSNPTDDLVAQKKNIYYAGGYMQAHPEQIKVGGASVWHMCSSNLWKNLVSSHLKVSDNCFTVSHRSQFSCKKGT